MKSFNNLLALSLFFAAQSVFATEGSSSRGGGDIQCDNLIQNLVFQDPAGSLQSWIKNGGPEAGKLDLSSSLNPATGKAYTYAEYNAAMLTLISTFANSPDVNCVSAGDKGYPVSVDDTSKICATAVDQAGVHMTCDRNLFMVLTTDQQIEQTHHEIAIHVPGLEPDSGAISTYAISDQLSAFISSVTQRRLSVVSPSSQKPDTLAPFREQFDHGTPLTYQEINTFGNVIFKSQNAGNAIFNTDSCSLLKLSPGIVPQADYQTCGGQHPRNYDDAEMFISGLDNVGLSSPFALNIENGELRGYWDWYSNAGIDLMRYRVTFRKIGDYIIIKEENVNAPNAYPNASLMFDEKNYFFFDTKTDALSNKDSN